jgi:hypothetical protein
MRAHHTIAPLNPGDEDFFIIGGGGPPNTLATEEFFVFDCQSMTISPLPTSGDTGILTQLNRYALFTGNNGMFIYGGVATGKNSNRVFTVQLDPSRLSVRKKSDDSSASSTPKQQQQQPQQQQPQKQKHQKQPTNPFLTQPSFPMFQPMQFPMYGPMSPLPFQQQQSFSGLPGQQSFSGLPGQQSFSGLPGQQSFTQQPQQQQQGQDQSETMPNIFQNQPPFPMFNQFSFSPMGMPMGMPMMPMMPMMAMPQQDQLFQQPSFSQQMPNSFVSQPSMEFQPLQFQDFAQPS